MQPRHQVSRTALELIERFEGYRRKAAQLPDGRWTIGYGHTKTARQGAEVSPEDAEALLIYDLIEVSAGVNDWTFAPLSQNQFDALCAFALNVGLDNFRSSEVLRRINEGAPLQAACALDMWRKAEVEGEKIVVDALVRRRAAEKALFLSAPGVHAPTPILPPQLDNDASGLIPRREPIEVKTALDGDQAIAERIAPVSGEAPEVPTPPPSAPDLSASPQDSILIPTADPALTSVEPEAQPSPANESAPEPPAPDQPAVAERFASDQARRVVQPAAAIEELAPFPQSTETAGQSAMPPLVVWFLGLGVVGLAVFASGIFFGLSAKPLGLALGLIGIVCVASAVYFLLERLGGKED